MLFLSNTLLSACPPTAPMGREPPLILDALGSCMHQQQVHSDVWRMHGPGSAHVSRHVVCLIEKASSMVGVKNPRKRSQADKDSLHGLFDTQTNSETQVSRLSIERAFFRGDGNMSPAVV